MALSDYRYYRDIKITGVTEPLSDFTIPVNLSSSSGLMEADTTGIVEYLGSNYLKIAATLHSVDPDLQCYIEIQPRDWKLNLSVPPLTKAVLWVKPQVTIPVGGAVLRLYYDIAQPDNTDYVGITGSSVARNVWDTSTWGCYLMSDRPIPEPDVVQDSSQNNNPGTPTDKFLYPYSFETVDGLNGQATPFDGYQTQQYINCGANFSTVPSGIQLDLLLRLDTPDSISREQQIAGFSDFGLQWRNNYYRAEINGSTQSLKPYSTLNNWHVVSFRFDGSEISIMIDGDETTLARSASLDLSGQLFLIGTHENINYTFGGKIEHCRLSNARSPAWRQTYTAGLLDNLLVWSEQVDTTALPDFLTASDAVEIVFKAPGYVPSASDDIEIVFAPPKDTTASLTASFGFSELWGTGHSSIIELFGFNESWNVKGQVLDSLADSFGFNDSWESAKVTKAGLEESFGFSEQWHVKRIGIVHMDESFGFSHVFNLKKVELSYPMLFYLRIVDQWANDERIFEIVNFQARWTYKALDNEKGMISVTMSALLPGLDASERLAAAIHSDRLNIILEIQTEDGEKIRRDLLPEIRVGASKTSWEEFSGMQTDISDNQTISVSASKTKIFPFVTDSTVSAGGAWNPAEHVLDSFMSERISNGNYQYRFPITNPFIKAGDDVVINGNSFKIYSLTHSVDTSGGMIMDLQGY